MSSLFYVMTPNQTIVRLGPVGWSLTQQRDVVARN
jgi:hypothetical protein